MALTDDQEIEILKLLRDGHSVTKAAKTLGINKSLTYAYAKSVGWDISWRDTKKHPNSRDGFNSKLLLSEDEILARRDGGEILESIAKDAGCTREYIRLLEKKSGRLGKLAIRKRAIKKYGPLLAVLSSRLKYLKYTERRKNSNEKRIKDDVERYYDAHLMWLNGDSCKDIIEFLKIDKGSFNWTVGRVRKKYGWFLPKRNRFGR